MEKKFQSPAVTLTLIGQCQMSNSSKLFPYTKICSSFKWTEALFLVIVYTDTHTDRQEYSIVDKPDYNEVFQFDTKNNTGNAISYCLSDKKHLNN